jgi:hypothetical protein
MMAPTFFTDGEIQMKIESHIRRKNGSNIKLGTEVYNFRADKLGRHVAEVTNEEHIGRLLSITECYTKAGEDLTAAAPPVVEEPVLEMIPDEPSEEDKLQVEAETDLELEMCETIVGLNVTLASAELAGLSDEALGKLAEMEIAGQARSTLLAAIDAETEARSEQQEPTD